MVIIVLQEMAFTGHWNVGQQVDFAWVVACCLFYSNGYNDNIKDRIG